MGGMGSGRWDGHRKARTVESCARLSIEPGGKMGGSFPSGNWRLDVEKKGEARFIVLRGERNGWKAEEWIEILFWNPRFGGKSFWLLCPVCGRKCRTLFTPPEAAEYRCRQCWKLVYESSQTAHLWDRGTAAALLAPIYAAKGIRMREVEKVMRREKKERRAAQRRR